MEKDNNQINIISDLTKKNDERRSEIEDNIKIEKSENYEK